MLKIGILGSGDVGKALAKGFLKHGYGIMIGSDHSGKLIDFKRENPNVDISTFEQAARSGFMAQPRTLVLQDHLTLARSGKASIVLQMAFLLLINRPPDGLSATSIAVDSDNEMIYVAGFAAPQGYQEVFRSSTLNGDGWELVGTNKT